MIKCTFWHIFILLRVLCILLTTPHHDETFILWISCPDFWWTLTRNPDKYTETDNWQYHDNANNSLCIFRRLSSTSNESELSSHSSQSDLFANEVRKWWFIITWQSCYLSFLLLKVFSTCPLNKSTNQTMGLKCADRMQNREVGSFLKYSLI